MFTAKRKDKTMLPQDEALVTEIVDAFIVKGLKPVRDSIGDLSTACALGALLASKERCQDYFDAYQEAFRIIAKRVGCLTEEAECLGHGIFCGFDNCNDGHRKQRPAIFYRGFAIGQEVWRRLHEAPREASVEREAEVMACACSRSLLTSCITLTPMM